MRPTAALPRAGTLLLVVAALAAAAHAGDPRPSWQCLPDGTAVMLRMPEPAGFLEALRARTKFGAVGLSEQRVKGAWKMLLDQFAGDGGWEEFEQSLGTYGLDAKDVSAAFHGDMGVGFVVRTREADLPPLVTMLAWLEPGTESAERLVAAAQKKLEVDIAADETGTTRRVDLEMAGHQVLWMVEPVTGIDPASVALEDVAVDPSDEEAVAKRLAELQEKMRSAKLVRTGVTHAFLARIGGRLLVGQTLADAPRASAPGSDADGSEELACEVFEHYLAAHAVGDGRAPVAELLETPGMAAALPTGIPLLEVLVDPRVFLRLYADEATRARLEAAGCAALGPIGFRQSLEDGRFRIGGFIALPEPRTGLMRIVDQPCDDADVPPFVTREAIDLTQISLDLGAGYGVVKEFAVTQGGEETRNMFTAIELQVQGWLGVELPALLSSLGSRHWIVNYPPRVAEAFAEARRTRDGSPQPRQVADRIAAVWRVSDEAPFAKILQRLAGAAGGLNDEQGFQGVRIPDGPAVYLGRDHLVVAIGTDSLEKTLAAIRNPPAGDSSLRESDVPRRAAELLPLAPSRVFGVSDSSRSGGSLGTLLDMVRSLAPEDVGEPYREMLPAAQNLLPGPADMEAMFGVGVTTLRADEAGLSLQTAWEMPAP
ncbi:MAG: hypothetical protein FJ286_11535 [Planctomycetes bacterium]|nr:hypothetical protein [Planctomycetota bacterium]